MVKNEKEWQEVRLGDIIDIKMGQSPKSEFYNLNNNGLPFLQGNKTFGHLYPSFEVYTSEYKVISEPNSILMSVRAPVGDLNISNQNICIGRGLCSINGKNIELNKYIFYLLKYYKKEIVNIQTGTVFGAISKNDILNFKVKILKDEKEQKKIASILSSLDDKIELNNRMNKILEEMAQTIFKEWFVNFNFPNEDGKPYKDSGGKMIESELGAIPEGWRIGKLDEIIELFDNKRIPLSNIEREKKKKIYPYYGAASLMDYVDDYIFDGTYVLLGEDGTVIDLKGYPILQYVYGKFWVNNHAHVIKGKNGFNEESLFILLKNLNVRSIVTGAVQPKINQNNLKSLKIIIPDKNLILDYNKISKSIFNKIKFNQIENQKLASIRDTLLPKLMSGEIRVK